MFCKTYIGAQRQSKMEQRAEIIEVLELDEIQKKEIFKLRNQESPVKLIYQTMEDFESYLNRYNEGNPIHLLVYNSAREICGWFFLFDRDGERWFAMMLDKKIQGQGYGSQLLSRAKSYGQDLAGWVIDHGNDVLANGAPYKEPTEFYKKNGFQILHDIRLENDELSAVKIIWKA